MCQKASVTSELVSLELASSAGPINACACICVSSPDIVRGSADQSDDFISNNDAQVRVRIAVSDTMGIHGT